MAAATAVAPSSPMETRCRLKSEAAAFLTMSGASLGSLDPAGWKCGEEGEIKNGELQCKGGGYAFFG